MAFTQGPRFQGGATVQFINLIKDMLQAVASQSPIQTRYNTLDELLITVNGRLYNLRQILKHQPDFEQQSYDVTDMAKYDAFLRDQAKRVFPHVEYVFEKKHKIQEMKKIFPQLTLAEMTAILTYTGSFFTEMDYLLSHRAEQVSQATFLANDDFIAKVYPDPDEPTHPATFYLQDQRYLAAYLPELLFTIAFACFALSKPLQAEINLAFFADSDVMDPKKMQGFTLALKKEMILQSSGHMGYKIYFVAYGKNPTFEKSVQLPLFDLQAMLENNVASRSGISLSDEELKNLLDALEQCKVDLLSPLLKTKLIGILTSEDSINDLMYENVYNVEPYRQTLFYRGDIVVDVLTDLMKKNVSIRAMDAFMSTSTKVLMEFTSEETDVVTMLKNPIMFGKNIEALSLYLSEQERLFIPGQQMAFTSVEAKGVSAEEEQEDEFDLVGMPIRSLDNINSFSYVQELIMLREQLLTLPPVDGEDYLIKQISNVTDPVTHFDDGTAAEVVLSPQQKICAFVQILVLHYFNQLIQVNKASMLLFPNSAIVNVQLINMIKRIMQESFDITLPENIDKSKSTVTLPVSDAFCAKTGYTEKTFEFTLDTVKNITASQHNSFSTIIKTIANEATNSLTLS